MTRDPSMLGGLDGRSRCSIFMGGLDVRIEDGCIDESTIIYEWVNRLIFSATPICFHDTEAALTFIAKSCAPA